jgi:magnesium transporter
MSLIGTVYGMNFRDMPALHEAWGFAFSVALMLGVSVALFFVFRRRGWL